ncbi:MFS transporter [Clostridium hydrogenum]|uniref:MFS transporter n=1 Tax=Clostridium hydrogenum TaxID=2855764 RepID=UPI001F1EB852|nr:MFS transporter [Clostridium hydrogenum]
MSEIKNKLWSRNYIIALLTNLFMYLAFYLLAPTLTSYSKQIGGTSFQASLVVSVFSITGLLCRFSTDAICNKMGKKLVIFFGLCILGLTTLSYVFVPIVGVILFRAVQGVGWGIGSTAIAAVFSEIVPEKRRGEGMGYYSLSMIVSMSVATVIAIMVMNKYNFNVIAALSITFVIISVLLLQGLAINKGEKVKNNTVNKKPFSIADVFEKKALLPSFLCFLLAITFCGIMSYIMIYGKEIKMNNIWLYFAGHVVAILITRPFIGKILDKKGHAVVILPGAVSMIIGLIILSYVHSIPTLVVASLFYGFGYGAVQPSLQVWAVNRSPEDRKVAANGTFLSSMDLGFTFGAIILSFIANSKSYAMMYRASSIFMLIFLAVYGYNLIMARKTGNMEDEEEQAS